MSSGAERERLTVAEAAELTGRHPAFLRRLIRDGRLPAERFGPVYLIPRDSLDVIRAMPARRRRERPE